MRAMVLAAGKGTRLSPLTGEVPKPLMPVAGVPIVGHVFDLLGRHGFDRVYVNAHHLGGQIVEAYGGGRAGGPAGPAVRVVLEPDLSGTAGGAKRLACAARGFGEGFDETFVVVMGDALTDVDLSALVGRHRESGAVATVALSRVSDTTGYGVVEVDGAGYVRGFQEKPALAEARSDLANTGIYVLEPEILARIPGGVFYDFARDVFPELLASGARFAAYDASSAYWSDVGTIPAYKRAHKDALAARVGVALPGELWGKHLRVGRGVRLHPAAPGRILGPTVVGEGTEIGLVGRLFGPVAVGDGCRIEDGAAVGSSILLPGASVGRGAHVEDCVVGPGCVVPAGRRVVSQVLVRAAPEEATPYAAALARVPAAV